MARSFKLPDLGEGIHEGEVIAVLVSVGEEVKEGDPILEVETDKASVEIPSPYSGKVVEIRAKAGDVVKVGDVLMTFSDSEEEEGQPKTGRQMPEKVPSKLAEQPQRDGEEITADDPPKRMPGPVPASPATRRLARELKVDLHSVSATGPGGLVTAEDVRSFAGQAQATTPEDVEDKTAMPSGEFPVAEPSAVLPDFSKWGPVDMLPLRSIRKATARQMALAWSQIPHVSSQDDIDVTRLENLRRRHKKMTEELGGRLTLTVFAVKAAAAALKRFPQFNVSLDASKGQIIRKQYIHIGVATDTGEGLVVPVLRHADQKNIIELAIELKDLVDRTRARKIALEELQGGTFTITNIGAAGGRGHFSPIINYPEAAILGFGAARLKPVIETNTRGTHKVAARLILPVVLTIDHRVLDGVDAARFLEFFRSAFEDPGQMLLSI
jgi:pyruvate dehydrogenase E2 component (dihydrolipoamide acetyltransferase)